MNRFVFVRVAIWPCCGNAAYMRHCNMRECVASTTMREQPSRQSSSYVTCLSQSGAQGCSRFPKYLTQSQRSRRPHRDRFDRTACLARSLVLSSATTQSITGRVPTERVLSLLIKCRRLDRKRTCCEVSAMSAMSSLTNSGNPPSKFHAGCIDIDQNQSPTA
jgi:hypothetical protein